MTTRRADLHAIIEAFSAAFDGLGKRAEPGAIERCALTVHRAMTGASRLFHTNDHVFSAARGADPIETLAVLFHDVVYLQVDQGLPKSLELLVLPYLAVEDGGARVRAIDAAAEPAASLVLAVFGVEAGARVSVFGGANELGSALVAARTMHDILSMRELAEVTACIEATIPFRGVDAKGQRPLDRLAARLEAIDDDRALGLGEGERARTVERAAWVANRDVENFAEPDVGRFLDNTWKLLPETNPALRRADVYTIGDYRQALQKMEGFLAGLAVEQVFQRYGDVPERAAFEAMQARAAINLDLSVRYLRLKLVAIAYLEALARATGGDVPLELFMGSLHDASDRLEHHLPTPSPAAPPGVHATLWSLVVAGRAGESDFDLKQAPLTAFLYRSLGESDAPAAVASARSFFAGSLDELGFLRAQPIALVQAVAEAAGHLAATRTDRLLSLVTAIRA